MPATLKIEVARSSAAEQVAAALRQSIMLAELQPGTPLTETAVATAAEVARSTARQALQLLVNQGLLVHQRNRGARVVTPSERDVRDVYRTREILETAGILAWPQAPLEAHQSVALATERLQDAAAEQDWETLSDRDMGFHASIVGLLASPRLDGLFANLSTEVQFYAALLYVGNREREDPLAVSADHTAIYEAMREGEINQALQLTRSLLRTNLDLLTAILRRRGWNEC